MEKLKNFLESAEHLNVSVLTGAGISAESGIKTFRDYGGLWENHRVEEVASPIGFQKDPEMVYRFYNDRRNQLLTCEPNRAHFALAELENSMKENFSLITQNVDDLHERAGSKNLLHMHGEMLKVRCLECEEVFEWREDLDSSHQCSSCKGQMRPHIVWFGEMPFHMHEIEKILHKTNLFVAIGTSGVVYPAAGFSQLAAYVGAFTVEINKESSGGLFGEYILGPATEAVEEFKNVLEDYKHLWE